MKNLEEKNIDVRSESIKEQIKSLYYAQDFEYADEFSARLQALEDEYDSLTEDFKSAVKREKIAEKFRQLDIELDGYLLGDEFRQKKQDLVSRVYKQKVQEFIKTSEGKTSEELLGSLQSLVDSMKNVQMDERLRAKADKMAATALWHIYGNQIGSEPIDLSLIEKLSTKEMMAEVIQEVIIDRAKRENEVTAFDMMQLCQIVTPEAVLKEEMWTKLMHTKEVQFKKVLPEVEEQEEKQPVEKVALVPKKESIFDRIRNRFASQRQTKYVFQKFDAKTGKSDKIKREYHEYPPKGRLLEKCRRECIELEINGVPVVDTGIFDDMTLLHTVTFGQGVKSVQFDENAWKNKSEESLQKKRFYNHIGRIVFSDDVEQIGKRVFEHCVELKNIQWGNNIRGIGARAFLGCYSLEDAELPDSITYMGESVFADCTKLEYVKLPKHLEELPLGTFINCEALEEVEMGDEISIIREGAFQKCGSLKSIRLPAALRVLEDGVFAGDLQLKDMSFGNRLEEIGDVCFILTPLMFDELPSSVKKVGIDVMEHVRKGKRGGGSSKKKDKYKEFLKERHEEEEIMGDIFDGY